MRLHLINQAIATDEGVWTASGMARMVLAPLARVTVAASLGFVAATLLLAARPARAGRLAVVQRLAQRGAVSRAKPVLRLLPAMAVACLVFGLAELLNTEPLLGCVTLGIVLRNAE